MSISVIINPSSEVEEIIQNVRTILATAKGSVPLDREFGVLNTVLDDPLPSAQAAMTSDIIDAITKYEPRAEPVSVTYEPDNSTGRMTARVAIRITPGGETVYV
ncbi:MAG: GPW/gp25 family protein [Armatimonadota bacterium]